MKKFRFLGGAHANESQYVKYCGMEETTKLLKLRQQQWNISYNVKKPKKIIGGITGSETIMSENKEELMTIYNYIERIFKTLK